MASKQSKCHEDIFRSDQNVFTIILHNMVLFALPFIKEYTFERDGSPLACSAGVFRERIRMHFDRAPSWILTRERLAFFASLPHPLPPLAFPRFQASLCPGALIQHGGESTRSRTINTTRASLSLPWRPHPTWRRIYSIANYKYYTRKPLSALAPSSNMAANLLDREL